MLIEPIMFLGLGFLVASLLGLMFVPLVHARAVRLTKRRIEASAPVSITEIRADKDQLRAEFAMSTRRLEMSVEQLRSKTTGQLADLGKKTAAINSLKSEVTEKTATIFALEAREKALQDQLRSTEEELSSKTSTLRDTERKLADKESELSKLGTNFEERSVTADSQRIEIVALKTQVATLRDQVGSLTEEVKHTEGRLTRERLDAEKAARELLEERGKVENLGTRIGQLERQLAAQVAEGEWLSKRITELENEVAAQERRLAEAVRERDQLRADLSTARRIEEDLCEQLATSDRRYQGATETIRTEKALAEAQIERGREERAKLQREVVALKREAETAWETERMENALLRERINDVAAEVARLTSALEGPDSPIETILAEEPSAHLPRHGGGDEGLRNGSPPIAFTQTSLTLADRIRTLQSRARLTTAN